MWIIQAKKKGNDTWRGINRVGGAFVYCPRIAYAEQHEDEKTAQAIVDECRARWPDTHFRVRELTRRI